MSEGIDPGRIASRALANTGIVVGGHADLQQLIAVSTAGNKPDKVPEPIGSISGARSKAGVYRIVTLSANDPITAIFLLAAALTKWEVVVPSDEVSPAARAVMKRYYDAHSSDSDKIIKNHSDTRRHTSTEPYMRAAYCGPIPGFDLEKALENGMAAMPDDSRENRWELMDKAELSFINAYRDKKRTKRDVYGHLSKLLSTGKFDVLLKELDKSIFGYEDEVRDSVKFIDDNLDEINDVWSFSTDHYTKAAWKNIYGVYEALK
jgi:hypothetical protein